MFALFRLCLTIILVSLGVQAIAAERALAPASKTSVGSLMKTAQDKGTVKVIVGFRVPFAPEGKLKTAQASLQRADIARAAAAFQSRFAATIRRNPASFRTYQSIPYAAVEVTPEELARLSNDPDVVSITANGIAKTQLIDSIPMIRADEARRSGFSGRGQTVAVIDTGVDKTHPFLAGKVVAEACFSSGRMCPGGETSSTAPGSGMPCGEEGCDHGTHVAGIVAGADSKSTGVAPDAKLIAVQVFSPGGGAQWSDMIAGIDYVYSRRNDFNIAAMNMSIGSGTVFPADCSAENPAMEAALANLRSAGIAPVVAAGNSFAPVGISNPACMPSAVAVGSVSTKDWGDCLGKPYNGPTARDKVACYSNANNQVALLAPGTLITSSVPGGGFAAFNGTSMAAPHVAGAFALLKQKRPGATVNELLDALKASGVMVSDYRTGQAFPRIDVKGGLDFLDSTALKLAYSKEGRGQGTVSFSPAGTRATCGGSCVLAYRSGVNVTLTAAPAEGSLFMGWSGDCSGKGICTVPMSRARAVTATFSLPQVPVTLKNAGTGNGRVQFVYSPLNYSINCDADCVQEFDKGAYVWAFPIPAEGSLFGGWSGLCEGQSSCALGRMDEARTLVVAFTRETGAEKTLTYEQIGLGGGDVEFRPLGTKQSCQSNCTTKYNPGTLVTVTAVPDVLSLFKGWSGACAGTQRSCVVTMSESKKVIANFQKGVEVHYTRGGNGAGRVLMSLYDSPPYDCAEDCTRYFWPNTQTVLTATPAVGSTFTGWSGACSGMGTCTLLLDDNKDVTANFTIKEVPPHTLSYVKGGSGSGRVDFAPAGTVASCAQSCDNSFAAGTSVTLTASPDAGSAFAGWSGSCSGNGACTVTMSEARSVTALFQRVDDGKLVLNFTKAGTGKGLVRIVSPAGNTECQESCANRYPMGTRVRLTVSGVDPASVFAGWTGACRGRGTCTVRMRTNMDVGAIFNARPVYTLNFVKAGSGSGSVRFAPDGDTSGACISSCAKPYLDRTKVTLTATAAAGSVFSGWSGACRGKRTCTVTMSAARTVTATFASTTTVSSTAP